MKTKVLMTVLAVLMLAPALARADAIDDLQARFEKRYPHLVELKQAGTVGETAAGYIEFVKPGTADAETEQFVQEENDDRTELYKLIAARHDTTPEEVAKANARRNFERAKPGEWLKYADGIWRQKEKQEE